MVDKKNIASRAGNEVSRAGESQVALRPPVDIYEDAEGITLLADMPGVSKERLTVQVDQDTLFVEGEAEIAMPDNMEALHADVRATRYRRGFTLSRELATDKVDAKLKDGVLTIRIPKHEAVRPRKIEVRG